MALAKRNAETLARSLRTALAPSGTLRDKLSAAELHVAYGLADQADRAIEAARAAMQAQGVTPLPPPRGLSSVSIRSTGDSARRGWRQR